MGNQKQEFRTDKLYKKAIEITAYFFDKLNVDDIYTEEEFNEFADEVYFMITTD